MRQLSEDFMHDLKDENGLLHPVFKRIQEDQTLMLAIRDGYINIYYRGGNLMCIKEKRTGGYYASFDKKYAPSPKAVPELPKQIVSPIDTFYWVHNFGKLKTLMDAHLIRKPTLEREFQQVTARINNQSNLANLTEYFITDIEFADNELNARFDLMGFFWPARPRTHTRKCKVMLMEMKYGDNALDGNAGILKHLQDFQALISNREKYAQICATIDSQFMQLDQLELLEFTRKGQNLPMELDPDQKPEVIFLFANHNPRSAKLASCLSDPLLDEFATSDLFDLRFFVSQFAGYALHSDCMVTLEEFRALLQR